MSAEGSPKQPGLGEEFENIPNNIRGFKTAQGSKYAFFDNGKTQRYKTVENEYREPSDLLVFVPDFAWFVANAPAEMKTKFADERAYDTNLILLAQGRDVSVKIVDKEGNVIQTSEALKEASLVYMAFIPRRTDGKKEVSFYLPVAKAPKVGFNTFDMTFRADSVSRHLGNKVVEIMEGTPLPASEIMPFRQRDPYEIS